MVGFKNVFEFNGVCFGDKLGDLLDVVVVVEWEIEVIIFVISFFSSNSGGYHCHLVNY